jgi:hypothetical protein
MYAVAASAAGVSVLAVAQTAEARIVYTPAHHVIGKNGQYGLALNHATTDFLISNSSCSFGSACNSDRWALLGVGAASWQSWAGNAVEASSRNPYLAVALKAGARISNARRFIRGAWMVRQFVGFSVTKTSTFGLWNNITDRYLGLKFKIKGKFHYGWARLNVRVLKDRFAITATLTGYAYETIPNKAIIAGKERTIERTIEDDAEQPATLGRLSLGRK